MEVSGQLHGPATLPPGKEPLLLDFLYLYLIYTNGINTPLTYLTLTILMPHGF